MLVPRSLRPIIAASHLLIVLILLLLAAPAFALESDELLLLVNKNAPQGKYLAEYYQQQRHVPAGRIVELALP